MSVLGDYEPLLSNLFQGDKVLYDKREEPLEVILMKPDIARLNGPRDGIYEVKAEPDSADGYRARHKNQDGSWSDWYDIHDFRRVA
jgi:hypothetical protein